MGITVRSVPFIDDSIVLNVTEASDADSIGLFSLAELTDRNVYVSEVMETGELIVRWSQRTINGSDHRSCFARGLPV